MSSSTVPRLRRAVTIMTMLGSLAAVPLVSPAAVVSADVPTARFRDLYAAPAKAPIAIAVTLAYHHANQLEQLIALQNDPYSPYYRHFLTSEQFAANFAPTPAEYAKVESALARAGFLITQTYVNRTVIDARGSVGSAERYFGTQIDRVEQPGHGLRYANVRAILIPPDIQRLIFAVNGLNNLSIVHADRARASGAQHTSGATVVPMGVSPLFGPVVGSYGPTIFDENYDFPLLHRGGKGSYDGSGRSAGIVIDADYLDSDLTAYLKYFEIKRTGRVLRASVDDGVHLNHGISGDSDEATLDVETLASNAPGANVYVYEIPSWDIFGGAVITDAFNAVVSQNRVDVLNASFGGCETSDKPLAQAWDHIAMQAAALGITFHASSGDQAAYGCSVTSASGGVDEIVGVDIPSSSPHVVAIGGTTLTVNQSNGKFENEMGWAGSGGGVSAVFALPSWQHGVKNVLPSGRNVPDVALDADPATGTAFYFHGTWNNGEDPLGGTSLSSPLFGAGLAEIDQVLGGRTGLAAQRLFNLWKTTSYVRKGTHYFRDITSGNNGVYDCLGGYSQVTGIGSLDFWNIAQALK